MIKLKNENQYSHFTDKSLQCKNSKLLFIRQTGEKQTLKVTLISQLKSAEVIVNAK
ncbi:hypothetical protein FFL01_08860 [Flavobacterium flevense]|uniref:Uncharacterized protein n=1 Tax=Flavobacterium flevense TaxID=983 RepID=A0A4Y4AWP1_9FLAO|nr:hypothetical protein FFL01_08860 [Flavobacterium flevense]